MYRRRLSTPNGDLWLIRYSSSSSTTTRGATANGEGMNVGSTRGGKAMAIDTLKAGRLDESGACSREHMHDYRQFEVLRNRDPDNVWIATLWRAGAFSAGVYEACSEGREVGMESPRDKCVNKGSIRGVMNREKFCYDDSPALAWPNADGQAIRRGRSPAGLVSQLTEHCRYTASSIRKSGSSCMDFHSSKRSQHHTSCPGQYNPGDTTFGASGVHWRTHYPLAILRYVVP
ncbi:hypothetical protein PC9H_011239 [Pleurotus ostreatus]|uniref:Uncharacterized protein n=1 Tax=Pleurotus ostreatus TaxID=5322 RepID=A0A8H6ZIA9_PLEOS|nr:uncharacterized protein PC9H_011239 [Pleurotus ostreatus]KAF7420721.1 hypothetical protein PC9H_011239 [Pleurotus ostreatus]KAJ8690113.1 hypothetical protein PTI98_011571 [Pleurotus ostreatus]